MPGRRRRWLPHGEDDGSASAGFGLARGRGGEAKGRGGISRGGRGGGGRKDGGKGEGVGWRCVVGGYEEKRWWWSGRDYLFPFSTPFIPLPRSPPVYARPDNSLFFFSPGVL